MERKMILVSIEENIVEAEVWSFDMFARVVIT